MKPKKLFVFIFTGLLTLLVDNNSSFAQQQISAFGGVASTNSNYSATFSSETVGHIFQTSRVGFYPGILDMYSTTSTGVEDLPLSSIAAFPNPAKEELFIKSNSTEFIQGMRYELLTTSGYSVQSGIIIEPLQKINVATLPIGVYILSIIDNNQLVVNHKIIKQ